MQDDLKSSFAAREKEINQQKKLDKVRQKAPSDRQQIVSRIPITKSLFDSGFVVRDGYNTTVTLPNQLRTDG